MLARRRLLAVGGSALAASLSGCLSSRPLSGHPAVRERSGQTVERSIYTPSSEESADPAFVTLAVGKRDGLHLGERKPHQVWARNEASGRRAVTIGIAGAPEADPWFRRTYEFAAGARLVVELRIPRRYAVTVGVRDRSETVEVPASRFDCNDSANDVVVRAGGIETTGATTDLGCSTF